MGIVKVKIKLTLRLTLSQSGSLGDEPHLELMTLTVTVLFCGAPSLTRGRVCLLYMLLVLTSVVFLESESLETRYHILLSQTWDFSFRGLLQLAVPRWRYSTPPPHGNNAFTSLINTLHRPHGKHRLSCWWRHYLRGSVFTEPLLRNGLHNPAVPPLLGEDDIENTTSSIVACWTVFTELFPGNVFIRSVTVYFNILNYVFLEANSFLCMN
jgi:hypothetical protein